MVSKISLGVPFKQWQLLMVKAKTKILVVDIHCQLVIPVRLLRNMEHKISIQLTDYKSLEQYD